MRTFKCGSCQAEIVWLTTAANKAMPVDAASAQPGDSLFDHKRHVSHFATCQSAPQHRKRAAKK